MSRKLKTQLIIPPKKTTIKLLDKKDKAHTMNNIFQNQTKARPNKNNSSSVVASPAARGSILNIGAAA